MAANGALNRWVDDQLLTLLGVFKLIALQALLGNRSDLTCSCCTTPEMVS